MKADPKIIEYLNGVLTNELTAINQYFMHAKMCENWGFHKLAEKTAKKASRRCVTRMSSWSAFCFSKACQICRILAS